MRVDGGEASTAEAPGEMTLLSVTSDIYVGGVPDAELPFPDLGGAANFSGCVEDLYLGPDPADFSRSTAVVNAEQGCQVEVRLCSLAWLPGKVFASTRKVP